MAIEVDVQYAVQMAGLPQQAQLCDWVKAAVLDREHAEVVVRIVDDDEGQSLNSTYRGRHAATNVLSFPCEGPELEVSGFLGDLVICAPVVANEAAQQGKSQLSHWAHMVIHGVLHLQGYGHEDLQQAAEMEAVETAIMAKFGYPNPYET